MFYRGDTVIWDNGLGGVIRHKSFYSSDRGFGQCNLYYNYYGNIQSVADKKFLLSTRCLLVEKEFWALCPRDKRVLKASYVIK